MPGILNSIQYEYLKQFRKENDRLILEMEEYAKEKNIPVLSWDSAGFLEQIIILLKPERVLEIGTAIAYSSIRIARFLPEKGMLDTLEKSKKNLELAENYVKRSGLENKINIIPGDALEITPGLKTNYDLIFLDADKEDYKTLFEYSIKLLKKNGVIFIDNLLWHGFTASKNVPDNYKNSTENIREFNKIFMNNSELKTSILPVGDGIGLGIKK